jgi:hypothetical protein
MPERTFSEEQIQALLRRATELQVIEPAEEHGLTQADLEQIAADAGIPPKFLRTAILESDHGTASRNVSGQTKTHAYIERVVPGDLTDDEWEEVVLRLRKAYSNDMAETYGMGARYGKGVTEQLGRTREWSHTTSLGVVTNVAIRSAEGSQQISFQRRVGLASPRVESVGYGFVLAMLAGMAAGGVTESVWVLFLVLAAVWAIAAPTVEYLDRRWRDKILGKMQTISDDIALLVANPETVETPEAQLLEAPAGSASAGPLDLDELEAPEPEPEADGSRAAQRSRG